MTRALRMNESPPWNERLFTGASLTDHVQLDGRTLHERSRLWGALCMAIYNPDPELLEAQIDSIKQQDYESWTCYVGIDGDDRNTYQLVKQLVGDDPRFEIHHFESNVGFYRNFERILGLVDARASWFALADQDDKWDHDKIASLLNLLTIRGAVAASGQARLTTSDGRILGVTTRRLVPLSSLILDNQITGCLSIFDRSVLAVALPFPSPTDVAYHDHWLGVCAAATGEIAISVVNYQDYTQHASNVIGEASGGKLFERCCALYRGRKFRHILSYVAEHRWGWRNSMAQELIRRVPSVGSDRSVAALAKTNARIPASATILAAGVRGDLPALRAAALLGGLWRFDLSGFLALQKAQRRPQCKGAAPRGLLWRYWNLERYESKSEQ